MKRLTLLALATGLVVAGAPGWAAAPEKTAWFSALSAGPLVVPAPTQADGDLRVAGSGERPTAYTTLSLRSEATGGELVVKIVENSAVGVPELALCPTKSPTWAAGANQPFSSGPEYDCSVNSALGTPSDDGTSVTFDLDSTLLPAPGTVSLAIVPLPEGTAPFQVDLREPDFTEAEPFPTFEPEPFEEPAPEPPPAAGPADGGTAEAPPLQPDEGFEQEPFAVDDAAAPELAGVDAETLETPVEPPVEETAPEPEVVLDESLPAEDGALPVAQVAGTQDTTDRARLLALFMLMGVTGAAGYAAGQQRSTPRIIGGRARALPAVAGGAAAGTAVAVAPPADAPLERGIGRFSRLRETAPRRLR